MKKVILLFVTVLLVLPLVLTGCGVAKSEYEAVVAERDAAQAQVASLQAERDAAQAQVASLQADQSDVASLVAELDKKLAASAMIDRYWSDAGKYSAGEMSASDFNAATAAFMSDFGGVLDAVGNDELSQMWDDAWAAAAGGDDEGFMANFAATMDLLTDLIEEDISAIGAKLS